MESNNLHHLQDQPLEASSSNLSTPSSCSYGGTTHSWTPNITLNAGNNFNLQEANHRSRASMIQDLGYHHNYWTSDAESCCLTSNNNNNQFSKIKEEISVANFPPKFSDMLNNSMEGYGLIPSTTSTTTQIMKSNIDQHKDNNMNAALSDKLLLKTLFSGDMYSTTSPQNYPNSNFGTGGTSRGNFSQIYPSINISNLNHSSSSLVMRTQSLDLLTSPTSFTSANSQDQSRFTDNLSFGLQQMQHPFDRSSTSNSSNVSQFTNGMAETKRSCTLMESKVSQSQNVASKKSRLESSRPSCPPFKVRKEKLGDRIAALQQLVAPFGKTDTASVLMEAIGYIKFLQGQVETLSVPYMKSSQNLQTNRSVMQLQGGSSNSEANGEAKQDLRSRGLCLVPLSCMSYIAGDGGSDVWQQPNFGRPT